MITTTIFSLVAYTAEYVCQKFPVNQQKVELFMSEDYREEVNKKEKSIQTIFAESH